MKNYTAANSSTSVEAIKSGLAWRARQIGISLLGEPSIVSGKELRWGHHGSFSLQIAGQKAGLFYDHEAGKGGDLLDLIQEQHGVGFRDALMIGCRMLGGSPVPAPMKRSPPPPVSTKRPRGDDEDVAARVAFALRLWRETKPLVGTLGEHYFIEVRKLAIGDMPLDHVLRWHVRINAVVALMTDPVSAEPIGVLRTFLNADGTKRDKNDVGSHGCRPPLAR